VSSGHRKVTYVRRAIFWKKVRTWTLCLFYAEIVRKLNNTCESVESAAYEDSGQDWRPLQEKSKRTPVRLLVRVGTSSKPTAEGTENSKSLCEGRK